MKETLMLKDRNGKLYYYNGNNKPDIKVIIIIVIILFTILNIIKYYDLI